MQEAIVTNLPYLETRKCINDQFKKKRYKPLCPVFDERGVVESMKFENT